MKSEFMRLLKLAVLSVLFCIFISATVAILLRTTFLASQKAFLFRLLIMTAVCCVIMLISSVAIFLKRERLWSLSFSDFVVCIGISALAMALFFSLGPMVIERSYTIYSLADMADHPEKIYTAQEIETRFIEGYVEGAQESRKRIDEQVYIGNLEEVVDGYRITGKGLRMVALFRIVEWIFPVPDKNSIYPNGW